MLVSDVIRIASDLRGIVKLVVNESQKKRDLEVLQVRLSDAQRVSYIKCDSIHEAGEGALSNASSSEARSELDLTDS